MNRNIDKSGLGCALLLVICEFLHDVMESRSFHTKLVKEIDKDGMDFQSDFLEFSEQCLQLLSKAAICIDNHKDRDNRYKVVLGTFSMMTSLPTIAKSSRHWSLSLLQSLQRLLDTPTFVAILQVTTSSVCGRMYVYVCLYLYMCLNCFRMFTRVYMHAID